MEATATILEATDIAQYLRTGRWSYALVNAAHIVGFSLLFGAIAAFDARLLGFGRHLAIRPLARLLLPIAICGLLLAMFAGFLLFMVNAGDYLAQPVFLLKIGLIAAGVANAVLLHRSAVWREADVGTLSPLRTRMAAALSLVVWLGAIICGRLLGFL